jgi:hypothetical protein
MKIDVGNGFYRQETTNGLGTKNGCSNESNKRIYSGDLEKTSVIITNDSSSTAFRTLDRLEAQSQNKVVDIFECILKDCPSANEIKVQGQYVVIQSAKENRIQLSVDDWNQSNSSFTLSCLHGDYTFYKKTKLIHTVTNNNNKMKPFNNQVNYFDQFF